MAKHYITYSCGHEGCAELFDQMTQREKRLEYLKEYGLCPDCYRKQQSRKLKEMGLSLEMETSGGSSGITIIITGYYKEVTEILLNSGFKKNAHSEWKRKFYSEKMIEEACGVFFELRDKIDFRTTSANIDNYKAELEEEQRKITIRKEKEEQADSMLEEMTLPPIHGSERQIAWAEKIRMEFLRKFLINDLDITPLREERSARFWIDNKDSRMGDLQKIIQEKAEEYIKERERLNNWKKIAVNTNNIECSTDDSVKINMPNKSVHKGKAFWISQKLLRQGRHQFEIILSINKEFEFKLYKGKNKTGVISGSDLIEEFGGEIEAYTQKQAWVEEEEIIRHTPEALEPVKSEAHESLKRKSE